ncbi:MAG: carbohydrate-binding family 9-like protein [Phycisphaerales bacterium]|jgi:hypothetical protein|nr:carbohydrate-binding family 9-like protein [Phycisphaerales bacterium]MBT7171690.1 carbohydrate-binding family 9-like protein [Phycisphaerales bacterium]
MKKNITLFVLTGLLVIIAFISTMSPKNKPVLSSAWDVMGPATPRGYICYKTPRPILVDGKDDDAAWQFVEWSESFADIEHIDPAIRKAIESKLADGMPTPLPSKRAKPRFATRAKLLWDDSFLYVYCEMEEPHLWAVASTNNEQIYKTDNDFEIYLDPDGDNQNYYEFEVSPNNIIWELNPKKTYDDGWVYEKPYNLVGLQSAVHLRGTLNDPTDTDEGWCVEVAIPLGELKRFSPNAPFPPKDGQYWRFGLARVEWIVDILNGTYQKLDRIDRPANNWVFSPVGKPAKHRPERWGVLQFSTKLAQPGLVPAAYTPDPTLVVRDVLMKVYHHQRAYHKLHDKFAPTAATLGIDEPVRIKISTKTKGYHATLRTELADGTTRTFRVRDDSLLTEIK